MTAEEISKLIRFEEYGVSPNPCDFGYIVRVIFDIPDLNRTSRALDPAFRNMLDGELNLIAPKSVMLEALALALIDAIPSTESLPASPPEPSPSIPERKGDLGGCSPSLTSANPGVRP